MTRFQTLTKAIGWRVMATAITFVVAVIVGLCTTSGIIATAAMITIFDAILKIGMYYIYDRAWLNVTPSKPKPSKDIRTTQDVYEPSDPFVGIQLPRKDPD